MSDQSPRTCQVQKTCLLLLLRSLLLRALLLGSLLLHGHSRITSLRFSRSSAWSALAGTFKKAPPPRGLSGAGVRIRLRESREAGAVPGCCKEAALHTQAVVRTKHRDRSAKHRG